MKIELAALGLLVVASGVGASSRIDRPLDESLKAATSVVVASVRSISASCGDREACWGYYRLVLRPTRFVKQDPRLADREFDVCSQVPADLGETYILFVEDARAWPGAEDEGCRWVVPTDGMFQDRAGSIYRINSPEGYVGFKFNGRVYQSNAVLVPDFREFVREPVQVDGGR